MTIKEFVEKNANKEVIFEKDLDRKWFIVGYDKSDAEVIMNSSYSLILIGSFDNDACGWPRDNSSSSIIFTFIDSIFIRKCWFVNINDIIIK